MARKKFFKDSVKSENWSDWKWQLKNRLKAPEDFSGVLKLTPEEKAALSGCAETFPAAVTPYFAALAEKDDPMGVIRRQVIPVPEEFSMSRFDLVDPCGEDEDSPFPGLIHRYPDRVVIILTEQCASYCRYCTRKRMVGRYQSYLTKENLRKVFAYLKSNPQIRDVLLSGGDPLILPDERLEWVMESLRKIPSVEIIRIGTRVPVYLPMRIDEKLAGMLKKYHPLWINVHFTHPAEITPEVKKACSILADSGIPLGSQTVLLKDINDDSATLKGLFHELVKMRIRPYYLYQCDLAIGTEHFRTRVSAGIEIIEDLRGYTSGLAVPDFVIDTPRGGGKVPVGPVYLISQGKNSVTLRNYEGSVYRYWEPGTPAPETGGGP